MSTSPHYEPLTEATFTILLSLASEALHGYAIMQQVSIMSEGRIHFSTGTLYGALKRLLEQGWIERVDDDMPEVSGRPRKAYRLTRQGREVLIAETNRLHSLATLAQSRLQAGGL